MGSRAPYESHRESPAGAKSGSTLLSAGLSLNPALVQQVHQEIVAQQESEWTPDLLPGLLRAFIETGQFRGCLNFRDLTGGFF